MSAGLDAVIANVQKLRRLAASTNVNAAAAAAAAADRLIQEHGLAEAQLESEGQAEREALVESDGPVANLGRRAPSWLARLCTRLSAHYSCSGYFADSWSNVTRQSEQTFHVVGRASDVATLRYMLAWLSAEIERLAQDRRGNGRAWLNSFRHGAVVGVCDAMREEQMAVREEAAKVGASAAIVLVEGRLDEAKSARDRLHPDLRSAGQIRGASNSSGFREGQRAGASIHRGGKLPAGGARALPQGSP